MKRYIKADLIAGLNEDLAHEYASVIQYQTYASTIRGPHRPVLRPLFAAEVADELGHAGALADAIVALGGTPTTTPAPVPVAESSEAMLRAVLVAEEGALARYLDRRRQAETLGELGLAVALDEMIADETRHRDEIRLVLDGWAEAAVAGPDAAPVARDGGVLSGPGGTRTRVALDASDRERVVRVAVETRTPWNAREQKLDTVSDASDDSFPASDPPAWTGVRLGPPASGR